MDDKKVNYQTEGLFFLKLQQGGEKITQVDFCKRRSEELGKPLSLAYFRKVLRGLKSFKKETFQKRSTGTSNKGVAEPFPNGDGDRNPLHDWAKMRAKFIQGDYKTLSALARAYDLNPQNYQFRKQTKGWKAQRAALYSQTDKKTLEKLTNNHVADKTRDIYAEVLVMQWQLLDILKNVAITKFNWEKIATPSDAREVASFVIDMQKAFERIIPNIQGLEKMADMNRVFDGLSDGSMDIEQAAIAFVRLGVEMPEPFKIMLQKYQPEEALPDDDDEITETQIIARRQEMLQEIEVERVDFVKDRKREVKQIKSELAHVDSFNESQNEA